jgi:hypothetical protein
MPGPCPNAVLNCPGPVADQEAEPCGVVTEIQQRIAGPTRVPGSRATDPPRHHDRPSGCLPGWSALVFRHSAQARRASFPEYRIAFSVGQEPRPPICVASGLRSRSRHRGGKRVDLRPGGRWPRRRRSGVIAVSRQRSSSLTARWPTRPGSGALPGERRRSEAAAGHVFPPGEPVQGAAVAPHHPGPVVAVDLGEQCPACT